MGLLSVFQFCLLFLATFRLMRMIRYDYITSRIRPFFIKETERVREDGSIEVTNEGRGSGFRYHFGEMLACHWCVAVWSSILLYTGFSVWPIVFIPIITILAIAAVASIIQIIVDIVYYE
ncbi:DUF1360 domain-containing protein [Natronobacillus azotifigens]|uniref:DUF1360 domain-containing protein n=1 Tax=Natronobacillus azotifigens TaxID=472978 RepID=A0A9J6RBQ2_9BACI|nr:DUF1360 domain-containing protein [Natronobacillus azotifigens]